MDIPPHLRSQKISFKGRIAGQGKGGNSGSKFYQSKSARYLVLSSGIVYTEMGTRYFKSSAAPATATCPKKERRYHYPLLVFKSSALPLLYHESSGATRYRYLLL